MAHIKAPIHVYERDRKGGAYLGTAQPVTEGGLAYLRGFVVGLLRKAELPTRQVTVLHRNLFQKARIEWVDGENLDARLGTCTREQLRSLIEQLRDPEDEDDE